MACARPSALLATNGFIKGVGISGRLGYVADFKEEMFGWRL